MPNINSASGSLNDLLVAFAAIDVILSQTVLWASETAVAEEAERAQLGDVFMRRLLGSAAIVRSELGQSDDLADAALPASAANLEILHAYNEAWELLGRDYPDLREALVRLVERHVSGRARTSVVVESGPPPGKT